jgi:hypothetical protein
MITIKRLSNYAEELVRSGDIKIAKFKDSLEKNASYAFEWSSSAFEGAAQKEIGALLLVTLEQANKKTSEEEIVKQIEAWAADRVLTGARYFPRSSSPSSNLMEQYRTAAFGELLFKINMSK